MAHLFRDVNVDETFGVRFLDHLPRVLCLGAHVRSRNHMGTGWSEMCRSVRDETRREERTSMDRSYFAATGMISFACRGIPHQPQSVSLSLGSPRTHGKVASEFADPDLFLGQLERRPAYFGRGSVPARREGTERLTSGRTGGEAGKHS